MSYYEDKLIAKLKETIPFALLDHFDNSLEPLLRQTFEVGVYYGKKYGKGEPIKIFYKPDLKYYEFNTIAECAKFLNCTLQALRRNISKSLKFNNYEAKKYVIINYNYKKL